MSAVSSFINKKSYFCHIFAKIFIIFVSFHKRFSRKVKMIFCGNIKTKVFVSTFNVTPFGENPELSAIFPILASLTLEIM
jgi:hypothetical protein